MSYPELKRRTHRCDTHNTALVCQTKFYNERGQQLCWKGRGGVAVLTSTPSFSDSRQVACCVFLLLLHPTKTWWFIQPLCFLCIGHYPHFLCCLGDQLTSWQRKLGPIIRPHCNRAASALQKNTDLNFKTSISQKPSEESANQWCHFHVELSMPRMFQGELFFTSQDEGWI